MDRKNCRQCGRLICSACSKNKRPLPSLGHPYQVRVCDLCFFNPCVGEVIGVNETNPSALFRVDGKKKETSREES